MLSDDQWKIFVTSVESARDSLISGLRALSHDQRREADETIFALDYLKQILDKIDDLDSFDDLSDIDLDDDLDDCDCDDDDDFDPTDTEQYD
jgi:hypothetical protein